MKTRFILLMCLCILACGKDDDEASFANLSVNDLFIIDANGDRMGSLDCLDPAKEYSLAISVEADKAGNANVFNVEFFVNGQVHATSFTRAGLQKFSLQLQEGKNTIRIASTYFTLTGNAILQEDFELVP